MRNSVRVEFVLSQDRKKLQNFFYSLSRPQNLRNIYLRGSVMAMMPTVVIKLVSQLNDSIELFVANNSPHAE